MHERITVRAIALTILGAVIGAGFASGQEVMQFFVNHGHVGSGIAISTVGFILVAVILTKVSLNHHVTSYNGLLAALGGNQAAQVFRHIFAFFLWTGLTVMIAGSTVLLADMFSLPKLVAGLGTAFLIYSVSRQKAEGLARANDLLMPGLIFLVLFFLLRSLPIPAVPLAPPPIPRGWTWVWSGLLYVAFNSAILFVVIPPLVSRAVSRRQAFLGVLGGILLLSSLLLVVVNLLSRFQGLLASQEIPMLTVSQYLVPSLPFLYAIPLWIAIATTAFADAMGLADYLVEYLPAQADLLFIALLVLASVLAQASFARLVALLYPLMGYACVGFCIFCLGRWILKSLTA